MPRSLAKLPIDLGIGHIVKNGFFPYTFNTLENESQVGTILDKVHFGVERMSLKKRTTFGEWYNVARHEFSNQYSLMDQYEEYCVNDVLVLRECCRITKTQFMSMFPKIDPLDQPTNFSAGMLGFLAHYLVSDTIGVIPVSGCSNKYNQSTKALEWLATLEGKLDTTLQTCRSSAVKKYVGHLPVGGYYPERHHVYQFHGWQEPSLIQLE